MSPEKIHGGGDEGLWGPESKVQANCTDTLLSPLLYSPEEELCLLRRQLWTPRDGFKEEP